MESKYRIDVLHSFDLRDFFHNENRKGKPFFSSTISQFHSNTTTKDIIESPSFRIYILAKKGAHKQPTNQKKDHYFSSFIHFRTKQREKNKNRNRQKGSDNMRHADSNIADNQNEVSLLPYKMM